MNTILSQSDLTSNEMPAFVYLRSYFGVIVISGIGGILPTLSRVGASLASNPGQPLPGLGVALSMACFFFLGVFLCLGLQEKRIRDAFILGIAAPGIVSNIVAGVEDGHTKSIFSNKGAANHTITLSIISSAHAGEAGDTSGHSIFVSDFLWGLGFQRNSNAIREEASNLAKEKKQLEEEKGKIELQRKENTTIMESLKQQNLNDKARIAESAQNINTLIGRNHEMRLTLEGNNKQLQDLKLQNTNLQRTIDSYKARALALSRSRRITTGCDNTSDLYRLLLMRIVAKSLYGEYGAAARSEDNHPNPGSIDGLLRNELIRTGHKEAVIDRIFSTQNRLEDGLQRYCTDPTSAIILDRPTSGSMCTIQLSRFFDTALNTETEEEFLLYMTSLSIKIGAMLGGHYKAEIWNKYLSEFTN